MCVVVAPLGGWVVGLGWTKRLNTIRSNSKMSERESNILLQQKMPLVSPPVEPPSQDCYLYLKTRTLWPTG